MGIRYGTAIWIGIRWDYQWRDNPQPGMRVAEWTFALIPIQILSTNLEIRNKSKIRMTQCSNSLETMTGHFQFYSFLDFKNSAFRFSFTCFGPWGRFRASDFELIVFYSGKPLSKYIAWIAGLGLPNAS